MRLAVTLGSGALADGVATSAWRLAQEFWGKERGLVPKSSFDALEHSGALIDSQLAEVRGAFVYVRGSSEYLEWHFKKREAAKIAGKKSAEKRRKKYGSAQPNPERTPNEPRTKSNVAEPSGSGSGSGSGSSSGSIAIFEKSPKETPVGVYIKAYEEKYGQRPEVGPREGKILKTFAGNHPDRWPELIRGYLQMPDSWAVQRSHPVEPLATKANEIGRFLATGKVVTRKVVEQAEELIDKAQGTLRNKKALDDLIDERERKKKLQLTGSGL